MGLVRGSLDTSEMFGFDPIRSRPNTDVRESTGLGGLRDDGAEMNGDGRDLGRDD